MMKLLRPDAPQWLTENSVKWGQAYQKKLTVGNTAFSWAQHQGENVRDRLLPLLREMTRNHCSFCDGFPIESLLGETIEHFKPKSQFPLESYAWGNLFLCCHICQKKGDEFSQLLLKPDEREYEFDRYFEFDPETGQLAPNRYNQNPNDQERAQVTITLYRLNDFNRPRARKLELKKFAANADDGLSVDDFSYRFIQFS